MFAVPGETVAQNLVGFLHNDEGIGIDFHNQLLQFCQLLLFHGSENHFSVCAAVGTLTVKIGAASAQLGADGFGDLLMMDADDQGYLGIVEAIHHGVHNLTGEENSHAAVEGAGQILKYQAGEQRYHHVKEDVDGADGHILILQLQKPQPLQRAFQQALRSSFQESSYLCCR